ncbi:glycosyltransferase [Halopseudomonas pachastrellae]|nr:glycosyltransferase [Halopseudomonas pachastrellae]
MRSCGANQFRPEACAGGQYENLGQTGNFNKCVRCGTGRYVVVLGSDDILYPGHLSALVEALDADPKLSLAYTQCTWIDEAGKVLQHIDHRGHPAHSYSVGATRSLIC